MERQALIDLLKSLYQLDPCDGSRWVETDDIEQAVEIACARGIAYLNNHVITWTERSRYGIAVSP